MLDLIKLELAVLKTIAAAIGRAARAALVALLRGAGRLADWLAPEDLEGPVGEAPAAARAAKPRPGGASFGRPPWKGGPIMAERAPAAKLVRARRQSESGMEVVGTLLRHGMRDKSREDGSSYRCYCADIETDDGVVEVVGVDLERAISAAGASPGDRVRAVKSGRVPVELRNGRRGTKNLWIVEKR